uniref:Uncharacterized protein n=1 Tax=Aegilops tauschii subsp. strangulata TaxID=200361 RepID=A0A453EBT2_AEGTS
DYVGIVMFYCLNCFSYLIQHKAKYSFMQHTSCSLPNTVSAHHVFSDAGYQTQSQLSMHQYIHCYQTAAVACI